MYFEGRHLKPYTNPISPLDLIFGEVYFSVTFYDDEMLIPCIDTMIFIGKDIREEDDGVHYFQDYDSFHDGERIENKETVKHAKFYFCDHLSNVFKFEDALDILLDCSLRRRKRVPEHRRRT